jgi:Phosphoribosylanthranilate isomerase
MTRVKICGITRATDLSAAVEAGSDAIGLISGVGVDTHRELDPANAADLAAAAPPFVTTTLVTMPSNPAEAVDIARTVAPDALQLHADFDADEIGYVRAETDTQVILAVGHDDHDRARALDDAVDALLVDSTSEAGGGGTGTTHDWDARPSRERAHVISRPCWGLTPRTCRGGKTAEPFGVDVASGVELESGMKDHNAVARFVANAGREVRLTP